MVWYATHTRKEKEILGTPVRPPSPATLSQKQDQNRSVDKKEKKKEKKKSKRICNMQPGRSRDSVPLFCWGFKWMVVGR